jgi:hypothetical protein
MAILLTLHAFQGQVELSGKPDVIAVREHHVRRPRPLEQFVEVSNHSQIVLGVRHNCDLARVLGFKLTTQLFASI